MLSTQHKKQTVLSIVEFTVTVGFDDDLSQLYHNRESPVGHLSQTFERFFIVVLRSTTHPAYNKI